MNARRSLSITPLISLGFLILASAVSASSSTNRPNPPGEPTEEHVSIGLLDVDGVDGVDGAQQSFEANLFYIATWQDDRLKYDVADTISRPIAEVWVPRLQLVNQQRTWATLGETVDISPSGEVVLLRRVWGSFCDSYSGGNHLNDGQVRTPPAFSKNRHHITDYFPRRLRHNPPYIHLSRLA